MKHIYPFLVLLLFLCEGMTAQRPIVVTDDTLAFGNSMMPGFSVIIPEVEYEKTMKNWTKTLQEGTKSKVIEESGKLSIFGAKVKDVSKNPVNIYSTLTDMNEDLKMQVAIELERDRFIGGAERSDARDFLFNFAKDQYIALASDQLDAEKKILRNLENELGALDREQARMEKSNRDNTQTISSEKGRLAVLNQELSSLSSENQYANNTDTQVTSGMGATDPKEVEKELKRISREIKSSEKKIERAEEEISRNDRDLPTNASEQGVVRRKVENQQAVVQEFETKLDAINRYK